MRDDPPLQITPRLLATLERIASLRQEVHSAVAGASWLPLLQDECRNAVERGSSPQPRGGENQRRALEFVRRHRAKAKITCPDLLRLHKTIATGLPGAGKPGRHRTQRAWTGSVRAPDPRELAGRMDRYLQWWNRDSPIWSPVISSAVLHARFWEIRPFGRANGRMARMIARWELVRRGFDPHGIFPVEERYLEDPGAYRAGLEEVAREPGEMTGWLEFAADALRRTLEKVRTRGLRLGVESRGVKTVFNARQEQVFSLLRDRGMLSPVELWAELGVTKQGAAKIVRPLLDAGMIRRIGTRKSGKYLMS